MYRGLGWLLSVGLILLTLGRVVEGSCRCVYKNDAKFLKCRGYISEGQLDACGGREGVAGVVVESTKRPACQLPLRAMLTYPTVRVPPRACYGFRSECQPLPCIEIGRPDDGRSCRFFQSAGMDADGGSALGIA